MRLAHKLRGAKPQVHSAARHYFNVPHLSGLPAQELNHNSSNQQLSSLHQTELCTAQPSSPSASLALGQVSPTLACELASRAPTSHIEPAPAAVHLQAWGSAGSACLVPPQAGRKLGEPARRGHQAMSCQSPSIKAERAAVFQTTARISPTVECKPGRGPLLYGGMRVQAPWECTVTLYYCSINRITGEESHTPARSQASCTERSRLTHLVKKKRQAH